MDRGWTRSWRREMDSAVWRQPPMYYKFWKWLHANAAHSGTAKAMGVKPGTLTTTYNAIAEGLEYGDPANPVRPSTGTVRAMLVWMQKEQMIRCSGIKAKRGTVILICNWARYQDDDPNASPEYTEPVPEPEPEPFVLEPEPELIPKPPEKKPPKKKPKKKPPYMPSEQAIRCLEEWEKNRDLPTNPDDSPMNERDDYHKVFDTLHTKEKLTWQQIGTIVVHATTIWESAFIQSPLKLKRRGSKSSTYPGQFYWQTIWTAAQQENGNGVKPPTYVPPGRQDWEDD